MKIRFFKLIYIILVSCGAVEIAYSQCANESFTSDVVEIPVVFEFRNGESRVDWMYYALAPRLKISEGTERRAKNAINNAGRLEAKFCVKASDLPPQNSIIYFLFGARKLAASVRPITWHAAPFGEHHVGEMPTIMFLNQADPDWLVVQQATWSLNEKKYPRLDIEIFNFGNSTHPGVNVAFDFKWEPNVQCMTADIAFATVPVSIGINKGNVKIASGDPQSSELFNRQATIISSCGKHNFIGELGPTGAIEGKATLHIRYSFMQKASPITFSSIRIPNPRLSSFTVSDLYTLFSDRRIMVKGERVTPDSIEVKNLYGVN